MYSNYLKYKESMHIHNFILVPLFKITFKYSNFPSRAVYEHKVKLAYHINKRDLPNAYRFRNTIDISMVKHSHYFNIISWSCTLLIDHKHTVCMLIYLEKNYSDKYVITGVNYFITYFEVDYILKALWYLFVKLGCGISY